MSNALSDNITVTHLMGGMMEMQRTGVYPNKLQITSSKYNITWHLKVIENKPKIGSLKIKRVIVYNYQFTNDTFKIQRVENGITVSTWVVIEVVGIDQD